MAKAPDTAGSEPAQTEHQLLQPIVYEGLPRAAGESVLLWPDQVERLRAQGVIE